MVRSIQPEVGSGIDDQPRRPRFTRETQNLTPTTSISNGIFGPPTEGETVFCEGGGEIGLSWAGSSSDREPISERGFGHREPAYASWFQI
jgi:hypothetical protein